MSDTYTLHSGTAPLVVSVPHAGTEIPPELAADFIDAAREVPDTDWHLAVLYDFVRERGASLIVPRLSRYVIDLNRPGDDRPMYAGANNTELCPTRSFTGEPLYRPGRAPDAAEVARRRERYWQPYHDALQREIESVRARHGHAVLFDGHSIRSELPWLFEGTLPDLNLGTASGQSCARSLRQALERVLASQQRYSYVIDGRFKGGHITRHYGRPEAGVHAVQLEMCWSCYMLEAPPYAVDDSRSQSLRPLLHALVDTMLAWRPER
jgi:N-formylglutamate deformylase